MGNKSVSGTKLMPWEIGLPEPIEHEGWTYCSQCATGWKTRRQRGWDFYTEWRKHLQDHMRNLGKPLNG
jgi:hypothetical protein